MDYDPNVDNSVARILDKLRHELARKNREIATAKAERDAIQSMLTDAATIVRDEQQRLAKPTT